MRRILIGTMVLTACAVTSGAQTRTTLDNPVPVFVVPNPLPRCGLATALLHLEQSVNVLIGFERQAECVDNPSLFPDLTAQTLNDLSGRTVRQVLDHLVALDPNFEWRDMNGVAVVRPVNAWNDPANALHVQVDAFAFEDAQLTNAVAASVRNAKLQVAGASADAAVTRRFAVSFSGGTILDALNAVIGAHGAAVWEIQSQAPPSEGATPAAVKPVDITVRTFDASGASFATPTAQATTPKKREP